jgi:hypothetical protein
MKIASYNMFSTRIIIENESQSLHLNTLIANKLKIASAISPEFIFQRDFDRLEDETVIELILFYFNMYPEVIKIVEDIKDNQSFIKKLIRQKRKDKTSLEIIGRQRSLIFDIRKMLKDYFTDRLVHYKLIEISDFYKEDVWQLEFPLFAADKNQEDRYIQELTKTISENEFIMSFNGIVEELFTFVGFDSPDNKLFDFIKIPLWHFPLFDGISFNQMKYTLEDLKPALKPFKEQFGELSALLYKMLFNIDCLAEIKQLSSEKLSDHISPVQQAIDNSLYISQLKNKSGGDTVMQFCLGITSAANLVNYYEKAEIIQPYVATETKDQLARHIDLNSACIFSYIRFNKN